MVSLIEFVRHSRFMKWIMVIAVLLALPVWAESLAPYLGSFTGDMRAEVKQTSIGFDVQGQLSTGELFERQFCMETQSRYKENSKGDPFRDRMLSWAVIHQNDLCLYDLFFSPKGDSSLRKIRLHKDYQSQISLMLHKHPVHYSGRKLYESLKPFFGTFEGDALSSMNGQERHLKLSFLPFNDGFKLLWETEIKTSSSMAPFRLRKASFTFLPSSLPGLYREDMRVSMFETARQLQFTKGDPLVWAILHDHTMTVFHLVLNQQHDYVLQIYRRTLSEEGKALSVYFTSYMDGVQGDEIKGTLIRK